MTKSLLAMAGLSLCGVIAALPVYAEKTDHAAELERQEIAIHVAATQGCMTACMSDEEYYQSEQYKQSKHASEVLRLARMNSGEARF